MRRILLIGCLAAMLSCTACTDNEQEYLIYEAAYQSMIEQQDSEVQLTLIINGSAQGDQEYRVDMATAGRNTSEQISLQNLYVKRAGLELDMIGYFKEGHVYFTLMLNNLVVTQDEFYSIYCPLSTLNYSDFFLEPALVRKAGIEVDEEEIQYNYTSTKPEDIQALISHLGQSYDFTADIAGIELTTLSVQSTIIGETLQSSRTTIEDADGNPIITYEIVWAKGSGIIDDEYFDLSEYQG